MKGKIFLSSFAILHCSAIFWMRNTIDFWAWSVLEIASVIAFWFALSSSKPIVLPPKKILIPLLLLVLWAAASILWSTNAHATLTAIYKILWAGILSLLFLNDPEPWDKTLRFAITVTGTALIFHVLFFPNSFFLSNYYHPNLLAGFLACSGLIGTRGFFLAADKSKKILWAVFCATNLAALLLVASTGAFIAWLAGSAAQVWIYRRSKLWSGSLILIALALPFLFVPLRPGATPIWNKKVEDPRRMERVQIWKDSLRYFREHFLRGSGLGTYREFYPQYKSIVGNRTSPYAHNEFLNFACELGGTGVFIAGTCMLFILISVRKAKNENLALQWLPILIAALTHALVDFNLHYPPLLVIFIFAASAWIPRDKNLTFAFSAPWKILLLLYVAAATLPGLADLTFMRHYSSKQEAAQLAAKIDPMNANYFYEMETADDLARAVQMEPRNIWFRRRAAQLLIADWEKNKNDSDLQMAAQQYALINRLAANMPQLMEEWRRVDQLFLNTSAEKRSK